VEGSQETFAARLGSALQRRSNWLPKAVSETLLPARNINPFTSFQGILPESTKYLFVLRFSLVPAVFHVPRPWYPSKIHLPFECTVEFEIGFSSHSQMILFLTHILCGTCSPDSRPPTFAYFLVLDVTGLCLRIYRCRQISPPKGSLIIHVVLEITKIQSLAKLLYRLTLYGTDMYIST
jgi:hypothetical protein